MFGSALAKKALIRKVAISLSFTCDRVFGKYKSEGIRLLMLRC